MNTSSLLYDAALALIALAFLCGLLLGIITAWLIQLPSDPGCSVCDVLCDDCLRGPLPCGHPTSDSCPPTSA